MAKSKISTEQAINMSLDEYIDATGVDCLVKSVDHSKKKNRNYKNRKSFNAGYENEMLIDESNDNEEFIPKVSSIQWRLKRPSPIPGMPPLVPVKQPTKKFHNGNNFNWNQRRQRGNWYDRDAPPSHLHGINRNNQPNLKPQNRHNYNMIRDVAHNATLSDVQMGGMMMTRMSNNLAPSNHQQQTLANLAAIGTQILATPAEYMDVAKIFIDKLAEIQQSRVNEPKYNMSVQKEISEIQGKTLYYSCGSGGAPKVISFDGPGVDDCHVRVHTTDMTMNQRFS